MQRRETVPSSRPGGAAARSAGTATYPSVLLAAAISAAASFSCGTSDVDVLVRSAQRDAVTTEPSTVTESVSTVPLPAVEETDAEPERPAPEPPDEAGDAAPPIDAGAEDVDVPEAGTPSGDASPSFDAGARPEGGPEVCPEGSVPLFNHFRFRLRANDRCMAVGPPGNAGGLPLYYVGLTPYCEAPSALWQVVPLMDGKYEIRNSQVALNLDVEMGANQVGSPAVLVLPVLEFLSQHWGQQPREENSVALVAGHALNRCLARGPDELMRLAQCELGNLNQEWSIEAEPCIEVPGPGYPPPPASTNEP